MTLNMNKKLDTLLSNIPYRKLITNTQITGSSLFMYRKGVREPTIQTLDKIVRFFNQSMSTFIYDEHQLSLPPNVFIAPDNSMLPIVGAGQFVIFEPVENNLIMSDGLYLIKGKHNKPDNIKHVQWIESAKQYLLRCNDDSVLPEIEKKPYFIGQVISVMQPIKHKDRV